MPQASHLQSEKKLNKSQPKAQDCYDVRPSVDHPLDCMLLLTANHSILTRLNITWQYVPSAPPAPPQHLSPLLKETEPTAGEGASGEGASRQGGGKVEDFYSEFNFDMTGVWPPVPPATHEAPEVEPGAGPGGGAEGNPPTLSVSPGRADFGGINHSSSSGESCTSRDSSDSGDVPALVMRPAQDVEVFDELHTLQSGRTRSQSWSLTMGTSCADVLLTYAMRTVEAKRTVEEKAA